MIVYILQLVRARLNYMRKRHVENIASDGIEDKLKKYRHHMLYDHVFRISKKLIYISVTI